MFPYAWVSVAWAGLEMLGNDNSKKQGIGEEKQPQDTFSPGEVEVGNRRKEL